MTLAVRFIVIAEILRVPAVDRDLIIELKSGYLSFDWCAGPDEI